MDGHLDRHVVPSGLLLEIEILDDPLAEHLNRVDMKNDSHVEGTVCGADVDGDGICSHNRGLSNASCS